MRNHFHLALETPQPNLADGMQWLQATFAARFSRFRSVSGHLFQGRYQALLIEDQEPLFQVANYIHLNPVRARVTFPEDIIRYEARQAEHLRPHRHPDARQAEHLRPHRHPDAGGGAAQ
jgi:hypothetical protein